MKFEERKKRIFEKRKKENDKKEILLSTRANPVAIDNTMIIHSIYKGLTLNEKKLYRYILSLIKKGDDANTVFILRHSKIKELIKHNFTSKEVHNMLNNISTSFRFENKDKIISIPIFSSNITNKNFETSEVIFNKFFKNFLFSLSKKSLFLKYELSNILDYTNLHSPELFELLLSLTRKNLKDEIVSIKYKVDILKKYLDCEKMRTNNFINQVIKKSIEDINKKNISVLGGSIEYEYNKTKEEISFYIENITLMIKKNKEAR